MSELGERKVGKETMERQQLRATVRELEIKKKVTEIQRDVVWMRDKQKDGHCSSSVSTPPGPSRAFPGPSLVVKTTPLCPHPNTKL